MKILVTGGGGFIASKLALKLAEEGNEVRVMYRSKFNAELNHPGIELVPGDLLNKSSLSEAVKNCDQLFHVAALANNWAKNSNLFYAINVTGTNNIIEFALDAGVKKIVVTSSAGTLGPAQKNIPAHENQEPVLYGHYERSKKKSEEKIQEFVKKGAHIAIVNPTRVFGPGQLSKSNAVTKIIQRYIQKKWKFIPGKGENIGNYAFIDDVVRGHLLAMEKGKSGERYILGGHNLSFNEFITIVSEVSGIKNNLVPVPFGVISTVGIIEDLAALVFGREPQITYNWVKKYRADWTTSTAKAEKDLGYSITPFKEAITHTIQWLNTKG